jgi:hypothetical protein
MSDDFFAIATGVHLSVAQKWHSVKGALLVYGLGNCAN